MGGGVFPQVKTEQLSPWSATVAMREPRRDDTDLQQVTRGRKDVEVRTNVVLVTARAQCDVLVQKVSGKCI